MHVHAPKHNKQLGLISFTLFLVQSFESKVDEDTLQAFEYSHIFVFSFAIMYVVQSAVLIASILPIQRRFVRLHAYGDAVAAAIGELPPPPLAQPQPSSPPGCYASLWAWFGGGGDQSVVVGGGGGGRGAGKGAVRAFDGFRAFRRRFLSKHALPASFLFDRYLIGVF